MSKTYRVGPCRILSAPTLDTDPTAWTDHGETRGDVVLTHKHHEVAFGRVDQLSGAPLADAVWIAPGEITVQAPMADSDAAKMVLAMPGATVVTNGQRQALKLPALPSTITARAFALIPVMEYGDDLTWVNSSQVIFLEKSYARLEDLNVGGEVADSDDAIHTYQVMFSLAGS